MNWLIPVSGTKYVLLVLCPDMICFLEFMPVIIRDSSHELWRI